MLPQFRFFAKRTLGLKSDNFDDAVQDLTAIAYDNYCSLVRRGKAIFCSPIARFAIGKYKSGRTFTGSSEADLLAERTKILGRSDVCSLSQFDAYECLPFFVDRKSNVAESVQLRIDFEDWYQQQEPRDRKIIKELSHGESTNDVARKHNLTAGSISIMRKRFANSWYAFIADKKESADCVC
jgi:hypothetical protein